MKKAAKVPASQKPITKDLPAKRDPRGGFGTTFELQNSLSQQQQSLQTIANTSKAIHDTSLAIIRKIS